MVEASNARGHSNENPGSCVVEATGRGVGAGGVRVARRVDGLVETVVDEVPAKQSLLVPSLMIGNFLTVFSSQDNEALDLLLSNGLFSR